jgi:hypothetical protein
LRIISVFNLSFEPFFISQDLPIFLIADVLLLSGSRSALTVAQVTSGVYAALMSSVLAGQMVSDVSWHVKFAR